MTPSPNEDKIKENIHQRSGSIPCRALSLKSHEQKTDTLERRSFFWRGGRSQKSHETLKNKAGKKKPLANNNRHNLVDTYAYVYALLCGLLVVPGGGLAKGLGLHAL